MHRPTLPVPNAAVAAAGLPSGGLVYGLGAYVIWGLFPLYVRALNNVPGLELVSWRLVLAVPICIMMMFALGQAREVGTALRNPKLLAMLALSAVLISTNWIIFIFAVLHGHVLATSMGYYINPLVNVLLGTVFLRERLSPRQWTAVGLAGLAVTLLAWDGLEMLGISLSLGVSFAAYGLLRKVAPVSAMAGLTIETILLLPLGIGYLAYLAWTPEGLAFGREPATTMLLLCAGLLTAIPLFLFAEAARRLDLSILGFLQYLTPTLTFLQGLFLFNEPLRPLQLSCFALIWLAIAIFSWDLYSRRRSAPAD